MPERHCVVVPHTHWDREWHRTHEEFRYRLVRLIDTLVPLLEGDPEFRHFTLDGQAIVLEDYFEVRPGERERVCKLVRDGRLLVGPWYVLPDEWLVSGEALIRNLRLGLRLSEEAGGAMQLGYAPDLFGHVGQLPQIFAGFGFPAACVWRGVGADVEETLFDWAAPDGTTLPTVYLRHGYGNAVYLPMEPVRLRRRLERTAARLESATRVPTLLLMNGSDHVEPQPGLARALKRALEDHPELSAEIGTIPGFLARALAESVTPRPLHRGEFRSALRAPLLPGCASARMGQKRADFRNDVLLTRYLEPLAAWLGRLGGEPGLDVIAHAWRIALQNHPHDSICGCSVDAVHEEIDVRLARVRQIATSHLAEVAGAWSAHVDVPAEAGGEPFVVWNPHGAGTHVVDGELELELPLRRGGVGPFHLRRSDGARVPATAELRERGASMMDLTLPAEAASRLLSGVPSDFAGVTPKGLRLKRKGSRLDLDVVLGAGPALLDLEGAKAGLRERFAAEGVETVRMRAVRAPRVRLRFADELPAHGVRTYRVLPGRTAAEGALRAEGTPEGGGSIANERLEVTIAPDAGVTLRDLASGLVVADFVRLVDEGDRGDEYDFDPVPGGARIERPERARVRVRADEAEARAELDLVYRVPAALAPERASRAKRTVALPVRLVLRLARGQDRLDVEVSVDNRADDHRLRLHLRAPFAAERFRVESAFEVAERPIEPPDTAFGPNPAERPFGTTPQRAFAALDGGVRSLVVANRGGGEVEALREPDGTSSLALTLLRAVGWLSRGDLHMRPGDAGPPLETPGAQVRGPHALAFAVAFRAREASDEIAWAQSFAAPPLPIWGGSAGAGPLADGARLLELADPSLLVSAIEPRADAGSLVRVWNASPEPRAVRLAGGGGGDVVDLAERASGDPPARVEGDALLLELRPWQIANVRS